MNKRIELLIHLEIQNPDIIVVTEMFPKNIDSTNIKEVEMKISSYGYIQNRMVNSSRGVCIYYKKEK